MCCEIMWGKSSLYYENTRKEHIKGIRPLSDSSLRPCKTHLTWKHNRRWDYMVKLTWRSIQFLCCALQYAILLTWVIFIKHQMEENDWNCCKYLLWCALIQRGLVKCGRHISKVHFECIQLYNWLGIPLSLMNIALFSLLGSPSHWSTPWIL